MNKVALNYFNNAIIKLMKKCSMSKEDATEIIKNSFLYEALLLFPEETIHDDLDTNINLICKTL